jgi:hypothetical protein
MHTSIPKPGYGHATAKFAIDFGDCTASGYLFTNGIAPEGFVIPGTAWTGGEIAIAPAPGGERAELFPSGRPGGCPRSATPGSRPATRPSSTPVK